MRWRCFIIYCGRYFTLNLVSFCTLKRSCSFSFYITSYLYSSTYEQVCPGIKELSFFSCRSTTLTLDLHNYRSSSLGVLSPTANTQKHLLLLEQNCIHFVVYNKAFFTKENSEFYLFFFQFSFIFLSLRSCLYFIYNCWLGALHTRRQN